MSAIDFDAARDEVRELIRQFQGQRASNNPAVAKLTRGKLYELFVLGWLLGELRRRGFQITLSGDVLALKQSPGAIQSHDTYFAVKYPNSRQGFRLYTDIEVATLGSTIVGQTGLCGYHEIDIVVVLDSATGRPAHTELALGVECKSNAKFRKSILKEVLGIRRETAYLHWPTPSILAAAAGQNLPTVPSDPQSEYYLCYLDHDGDQYAGSPKAFGIEFRKLIP